MATVSRQLPPRPHLDVPKREARELLTQWRDGQPEALERVRHAHPGFNSTTETAPAVPTFKLSDAQRVIAREYGFANWAALKQRITAYPAVGPLQTAIEAGDREGVVAILKKHPQLLHLPVWSGNWGPPMSHAANLGRLEIVQAAAALGARDTQHAFGRAVLQGKLECARWLQAHGANLEPGVVMGPCETLNVDGLRFLLELGAPLVDQRGDRLAPLALVLGTYCRHPAGKHAILELFRQHRYELPDTPVLALHRGDLAGLEAHLRRDPSLLKRHFNLGEIYPEPCGCSSGGKSGMHWTPVDGTTLLHLAVDFRESEIFAWLLKQGADPNARAQIDAGGFGGHTPLFNSIVNGTQRDPSMASALLDRGANPRIRASLRKFLDWCEQPRWHEAREVTPVEWGRTFPEQGWVNQPALSIVEAASEKPAGN